MSGLFSIKDDFILTDGELDRIRELVYTHTGISMSQEKRQLIYTRLSRRLRALGLSSFNQYISYIEQGDPSELQEFTNAVTTNLTAFFRESRHFDHLGTELLPSIAQRIKAAGRLRIWSSACSTGEEAYSAAMVIRENESLLSGVDTKILATDLDSNVLATAKAGVYDRERIETVLPSRVAKFFEQDPSGRSSKIKVSQSLQDLISFKQLNLTSDWPMKGPFDIIFCRNVIIYFDEPTKKLLFERMAALQRPGDILYLGHSETLFRISDRYELIGNTTYKRVRD